ncbi:glutathione-dependent formaldehyde-activating gfa [Coniochaeta ligniaria NRRL 30616]|uniref:Glutathione-dependent formaldehyde-activating gfa n=1 Tax=Coniochaeta ligniaria NRRL 30616 TaxID=1408157 RepID=A0A1J7J9Y3_9PEZI|nr:glutathione-dependent formaldehyde-activating gfa [Coniochaeta ligniaria NRRL 30616]
MEDLGNVYHGNCHCGGYRFDVRLESHEQLELVACDCALCQKQGYLWYMPLVAAVEVIRDDGNLVEYRSTTLEHKFCGICGTGVLGKHFEGPLQGRMALNGRAFRALDPFSFEHDRSVEPASLPRFGSCDCGKVKVEILHVPEDADIKEDNCSICTRNAWIGIYPRLSEVKVTGAEHLTDYRFGRRFMGHPFCKICGVHVVMNVHGPPQHVVDRLPEDKKEMVRRKLDLKPVNIRVPDRVELSLLSIKRSDEGTDGYERDVLVETDQTP